MMTEQERLVVNCLKAFASATLSNDSVWVEDAVEKFMENAQIAFSPEGKQELIEHIKSIVL